jgi:hypothetical protein
MADLPTNPEEVKAVIQEVNKPEGFPGTFTLGDGTVVKAASWEEAFQKVADMKVNTATALRDRERQIEEFRNAPSQSAPPDPALSPTRGMTPAQQKQYWEYANQDPILADDYKDSIKYGIPMEQVAGLEREIFNASQYSADSKEITTFQQKYPDYPGDNESLNKIFARMEQEGLPITARNLGSTYLELIYEGELQPVEAEAPKPWVPPNLQGGSTNKEEKNIMQMIADTPDDKLDDVYRRLGLLK